jgi:disulfide oxidoreductase YuzD
MCASCVQAIILSTDTYMFLQTIIHKQHQYVLPNLHIYKDNTVNEHRKIFVSTIFTTYWSECSPLNNCESVNTLSQ